jgi:hypothetical protein
MVFRLLAMLFCLLFFSADSFASEVYSYSKNNSIIDEMVYKLYGPAYRSVRFTPEEIAIVYDS